MPTALSGEYLKFGTLSCLYDAATVEPRMNEVARAMNPEIPPVSANDCDGAWIPRAFYSLGVIVVAPVGILYHISMAAFRVLQRLWTYAPEERKNVSTWMWQHLYAAGMDLLAFGMIFLGVAIVASIVAAIAFMQFEWLMVPVAILLPQIFDKHGDPGAIIMPYNYAQNPVKITENLLATYTPEGEVSEQEKFTAEFVHYTMRKISPDQIRETLTPAELTRLAVLVKANTRESNIQVVVMLMNRPVGPEGAPALAEPVVDDAAAQQGADPIIAAAPGGPS